MAPPPGIAERRPLVAPLGRQRRGVRAEGRISGVLLLLEETGRIQKSSRRKTFRRSSTTTSKTKTRSPSSSRCWRRALCSTSTSSSTSGGRSPRRAPRCGSGSTWQGTAPSGVTSCARPETAAAPRRRTRPTEAYQMKILPRRLRRRRAPKESWWQPRCARLERRPRQRLWRKLRWNRPCSSRRRGALCSWMRRRRRSAS